MSQNHTEWEFSPGYTHIHIWKVSTINCRQATHRVNPIQFVDRDRKKDTLCLSVCLSLHCPQNSKKTYIPISSVKIRSKEAGGMQKTRINCYCLMWPPAPQMWVPGEVHVASHKGKGRVVKDNMGALGPKRKLRMCVWKARAPQGTRGDSGVIAVDSAGQEQIIVSWSH